MKKIKASTVNINRNMINSDALHVIQKLQQHNFDGFIVGGGVRDLILGKIPKDFDIVTDATPEQVKRIFKRNSMIIGRRFKIVHVYFDAINPDKIINNRPVIDKHILEVSTYRSNKIRKQALSVHGRILEDNVYGTIEQDSTRRDFTVNALYYDPINEIILDNHGGLADLHDRILRIIGNPTERYIEDPVRILRAIRLSIKLDLQIEEKTQEPFVALKHLLANEPSGRTYEEMLKILRSGHAAKCIQNMRELNMPRGIFPLFDKLFFKKSGQDDFALRVVAKTDERIAMDEDVSTIFILSGLMWSSVSSAWQDFLLDGGSPYQALVEAITQVSQFAYQAGITRHAFGLMTEIWLLQLDFDNPRIKRMEQVTKNIRLRQAWHLYATRHEFNLVDPTLFNWWQRFMEADENTRHNLQKELEQIIELKPQRKAKKRGKKLEKGDI